MSATSSAPLPARFLQDMDMLRGLAAFAVLVGHVRGLWWVDYADVERPSRALQAVYVLSGLGHQAVVVFFVLSGFFVGHSVLCARAEERFSWQDYLLRRWTRLYVVLLPALLLTGILDASGIALFGTHGTIYGGELSAEHLSLPNVANNLTFGIFAANVAMLEHVFGLAEFGSNGPLWSLPYEFWAYLLFPALIQALGGTGSRLGRAALALSAAALLAAAGWLLAFYFALWAMGAAAAGLWLATNRAGRRRRAPAGASIAVLGVFAVALVVARLRFLGSRWLEDAFLAIATAASIATWLHAPGSERSRSRWYAAGAAWLAGLSYTLYLTHYPVIAFVHAASMGPVRWQPTAPAIATLTFLPLLVVVLVAAPFAAATEKRTDAVRRWLSARLTTARTRAPIGR